jgi:hypothetical protein
MSTADEFNGEWLEGDAAPPSATAGVSTVYSEEGRLWMRVSPGHSISARWLEERAPDLYARWWDAPSLIARDQVARDIEKRLEDLETAESWEKMALQYQAETARSPLADRVARYEAEAAELGATSFDDPRRTAAHRSHQAVGDALRDELAAAPASEERDQLARRLDTADLVADRPFIEAVSQMSVDRLAVAALNAGAAAYSASVAPERVQAEMTAEDPHAALRADVPPACAYIAMCVQ